MDVDQELTWEYHIKQAAVLGQSIPGLSQVQGSIRLETARLHLALAQEIRTKNSWFPAMTFADNTAAYR